MIIKFPNKSYIAILCIYLLVFGRQALAQTNVVTQHNNLSRTGWNNTEYLLNTKNVSKGLFGKLFTRPVDDQLYAQLLIMNGVSIPGKGKKNIVFAATVNNSVYAYDADSANITDPYWQVNLTPYGLRPVHKSDETGACGGNYKDFSGNMGIVSTPVIDTLTNTIYIVARSVAPDRTNFVQYLHALDVSTGGEKQNSPVLITAQVPGTGTGVVNGIITFDAQKQNQRSGLLLLNGKVYITYASHCDWGPYHGWILGYDATTLQQTTVYNSTPDGYNGGIWMSGAAPSADEVGNIYVAVGNGSAGYKGDFFDSRNRSESAVKLTPSGSGLTVSTFFTPNNYTILENGDLDFGSTEMMLIPNTNRVMTGCKDGKIYLMNRDDMGGYNENKNNVVQTIDLGTNAHLRSSFAYYKGSKKEFVYSWSENTLLKAFPYSRTSNNLDVTNVINSGVQGPIGNSGAFLSVSSNGSVDSTAILWTSFAANGDANQSSRPGILYAFGASDITKELWNSGRDPNDDPGNYAKFNCPTIANGKVYLATFSNQLVVYGLTGNLPDTCNSTDIALNKPAYASSIENDSRNAAAAFDGNANTRWASLQKSDPQYIFVDLGERYDLCAVTLKWEVALGKNFTIDVSDDSTNWTTIATITNNTSFYNYIPVKGSGQYVRMFGTARGTNYGYSLYSFGVYGYPAPGDCPVPTGFIISGIYENSATINWQANSASAFDVQYKAVSSANWTTITLDTNAVTINNLVCGTDYLYKVRSVCGKGDTGIYSEVFSFSALSCGSNCNPLPTRWSSLDIGNTSLPGSACYIPETFTIKSSGDDIGGNSDGFHFAFKTLVGDGEFTARVASMDKSNDLNKCGIMIRESLEPGSKNVFIALTGGNGATFQSRVTTDGNTTSADITEKSIASPYWIKLVKTGSVYAAAISPDGSHWTDIGGFVDAGFGNGTPVYAGLALTSHNNNQLSNAEVDNYNFTNGVLPVSLTSFSASLNLSYKVDLKWITTLETNSSYFIVERRNDNHYFEPIDTIRALNNGPFTSIYTSVDNFPEKGTNYYRLKIVNIDGNFTYSALQAVRLNISRAPVLYPNPAKTFINIAQGTEVIKLINVYDVTGQSLIRMNNISAGNMHQVPVSNLMRGTYIVEIRTATAVYREKLLIR